MSPLPIDARSRAGSFLRLGAEMKEGILKAIEILPVEDQASYIKGIMRAGGVAADFVSYVIGHPASKSPQNKQRAAAQSK